MDSITVNLLHHTPLEITISAIRNCWDSGCKKDTIGNEVGENDRGLFERIVKKHKHLSTIEHIVYSFLIDGISRGCLQELARHRLASYSVKSTRYTLKKDLAKESSFTASCLPRAKKYIVITGEPLIDHSNIMNLENLRKISVSTTNDLAKYTIPECFRTKVYWTINARSLRNFLELRSKKGAHFEIQYLSHLIIKILPKEHIDNLFSDIINTTKSTING